MSFEAITFFVLKLEMIYFTCENVPFCWLFVKSDQMLKWTSKNALTGVHINFLKSTKYN